MRTSVSVTSFFSSLRGQTSQLLIPIIKVVGPTDPAPPHLTTGPNIIRRWRGALGALEDKTLQLPSQGLTSGARLALARRGFASGSFRLNCSESLYVRDSRGLAMFQRIELEEELEKARLGLRERPPMRAATGVKSTEQSDEDIRPETDSLAGRQITRRPSFRTQRRNIQAVQNMRFNSGGLSSCATFTEGLCHLEDYVRASDSDLPAVCSEKLVLPSTSAVEVDSSWLNSLRKMTFSAGDSTRLSKTKRRKSAGDVMKSFSCVDLHASFSVTELTVAGSLPSLDSKDASPSKRDQAMSPVHQVEEQSGPITEPTTSLRREGSWTRLCRRLSGKVFKKRPEGSDEVSGLDQSFSVATGLFRILEQEVPASCGQPLTAGLEPL